MILLSLLKTEVVQWQFQPPFLLRPWELSYLAAAILAVAPAVIRTVTGHFKALSIAQESHLGGQQCHLQKDQRDCIKVWETSQL
jgi:hypothetical protein